MDKCIINLATGRYIKGQARLAQSVPDVDKLFWQNEADIGAPPHNQNQYAFKIFGFREAERQGYRFVLWVDASVWAVRDTQPIFDHIKEHGYIMQEAGHLAGRWANDKCLEYFKITRDEAFKIPCYGNAGFLGLDLHDTTASVFLQQWEASMLAGAFKGGWHNKHKTESQDPRCDGHRHDLVCGSIIANKLGMKYENGGSWLAYASPMDKVNESVILKAQGV